MLIKISSDTWRDIFDCLSPKDRRKLARKFKEIGDREFSDIFQKWLHEWIKDVRIGRLKIDSIRGAPRMQRCDWHQELEKFSEEVVSFAESELPDNIRNFREIKLSFVDTTVLQFLRRMQPLFHDVSLSIKCSYGDSVETELTALAHLMPLLSGSIHTIKLYKHQLLLAIRRQFPAQLLAVKHLFLGISVQISCECIELLVTWLGTRCADGEPRTLTIWNTDQIHHQMPTEFIQRIRQQFLDAKQPCSFFICFITHYEAIPGSTTQNAITSEQLIIRPRDSLFSIWLFSIGRCPAELDGQQWMEEMGGKCRNGWTQMKQRNISIFFPEFGQFDEAKLLVKEEGAGEQEEDFDQQPGPSSKKSKLTS